MDSFAVGWWVPECAQPVCLPGSRSRVVRLLSRPLSPSGCPANTTHGFQIHRWSLALCFGSEQLGHLFSPNLIPQFSILSLNPISVHQFRVYCGAHFGKCWRCNTHTVAFLLELWVERVRSDTKCAVVRMPLREPPEAGHGRSPPRLGPREAAPRGRHAQGQKGAWETAERREQQEPG